MKKFLALLLFCTMICVGSTAKSSSQKPIKTATSAQLKTFAALYKSGDVAFKKRDIQYLQDNMAADFALRLPSGEVFGHSPYLQHMTEFYDEILQVLSATSRVEKLNFQENRAFAIVTGTYEITMRDESKKVRKLKSVQRWSDVWILTPGGWEIQSVTAISERQFVDGRQTSFVEAEKRELTTK